METFGQFRRRLLDSLISIDEIIEQLYELGRERKEFLEYFRSNFPDQPNETILGAACCALDKLRDAGPGTPLGRLGYIIDYAEEHGLCNKFDAKPPEVTLIEELDRLRAEVKELKVRSIDRKNKRQWFGQIGQ